VLHRVFSDRAQGGDDVLESRDKGATSEGQWDAIYCYGYAALRVATAENSSVNTIMLIMDGGRAFLILRVSECGCFHSWDFKKMADGLCDARKVEPTGSGAEPELVPCCG
jgi:hypothetical protein